MADQITAVIDGWKGIFGGLNPTPSSGPSSVYNYRDEYAQVDTSGLPVVICMQEIGVSNPVRAEMKVTKRRGQLIAYVLLQKASGNGMQIPSKEHAAAMQKKKGWDEAVKAALFADSSLNGSVLSIGDDQKLFESIDDHLQWDGNIYWGIVYSLPYEILL